jgi:hypothetical protein
LVTSGASESEAAAIVAALEQFLAETSPRPAGGPTSRWQQAALREGVSARETGGHGWGAHPLSRPPLSG